VDIAVIIPCYNSAAWVGDTVESVLRQTVPPAEVIVVNDGSTDDSRAVLRRYEPRIRVLDQSNRGLGGARNSGARAATSPWLAFLDADDIYEPDFVENVRALRATYTDAQMLFTDHIEFGEGDVSPVSLFRRYIPELRDRADAIRGDFLLFGRRLLDILILRNGAFAPSTLVVSRDLFDRVGGFYEKIYGVEDLDFYAHTAPQTAIGVIDRPLLRKRLHAASISHKYDLLRPTADIFYDRAVSFCRRHCPKLLPLMRLKHRRLLRSWGRHECRLGLYANAQKTFSQLVRIQPLHPENWYGLAQATLRQYFLSRPASRAVTVAYPRSATPPVLKRRAGAG
jgi:glycosyltransferase involved in cell wall biosynthesis